MEETRKLVSVVTIDNITPIEGADKIELACVGGWNVVVGKDEFKVDQEVFYFEIDSMLPLNDSRFSFLEIRGKKMQDGILYHKLKTVKLRGQISQGLIMPLSIWNPEDGNLDAIKEETNSFAEYFKVVKYEEPTRFTGNQKLTNWPDGLDHTDEERLQNLVKDWKYDNIKKLNWVATEKIDGCSITMFCEKDGPVRVCSRNWELSDIPEDPYWKVVRETKINDTPLVDWLKSHCCGIVESEYEGVCLQGELFGEGIQSNRLGVKGQHIRFYNLLIKIAGKWSQLPIIYMVKHFPELEQYWVPIMPEYSLSDTLDEAIKLPDGIKSHVPEADKNRQIEGIVWRVPDMSNIQVERQKEIDWSKIPEEKRELVKEANIKLETKKASFKIISNKYLLKTDS